MPISLCLLMPYIILLLLLSMGVLRYWKMPDIDASQPPVMVSVVVPFRNERENLLLLLDALMRQSLPAKMWELVLVDDGSSDGYMELIAPYFKRLSVKLCRLPAGISGKKQAVIRGVAEACYSRVALIDADVQPDASWLETIASMPDGIPLAQGAVIVRTGDSLFRLFDALDYASLMAVSLGSFSLGHPVVASSANMVIGKDMLGVNEQILRIDIASGDDMFLLHEAKRRFPGRLRFISIKRASVYTRFNGGLGEFFNRRVRWGSKASAYTDRDTILVAAVVLATNMLLVGSMLLSVCGVAAWHVTLALWLLKALSDLLLLVPFLYITAQLKLLAVFLPLQLFYPFYLVAAAVAPLLSGWNWKGRRIA